MRRPPSQPQLTYRDLAQPPIGAAWASLLDARRVRLTYSGRGAIYQVLRALGSVPRVGRKRTTVLVPAFHCPTVVDPVLHAGYKVRFFGIDENLKVDQADLLRKVDADVAAAIIIRYFGFAEDLGSIREALRSAGVALVDDRSHSFLAANPLSLAHSDADATIYSFWKLVPCGTGGGILPSQEGMSSQLSELNGPDLVDAWKQVRALGAQVLERQHEFMSTQLAQLTGRKRPCPVPRPAERMTASEAYPYHEKASQWRMHAIAKFILSRANLQDVVDRRRRNFAAFAETLAHMPEFSPLHRSVDAHTCPWGFPVMLRQRRERDYLIRARGVPVFTFGEVLHPHLHARATQEKSMVDKARSLSDSLLAIAIHQGLAEAQMKRFAAVINDFIGELGARP